MKISNQELNLLKDKAQQALTKAYAPYSKFRVGAAILTDEGNIFTGCNIENSSYGLTICAERAAVASAIANEGGEIMKIRAVVIVTEPEKPCAPCGACRQVLSEFGLEAIVFFQGQDQEIKQLTVAELLPEAFELTIRHLHKP
ncbi:MAG: cytidine deaminase [Symploca sp. SIO2C1]|nr:cytidine deaminase [Symploca sp. SIO2C1]